VDTLCVWTSVKRGDRSALNSEHAHFNTHVEELHFFPSGHLPIVSLSRGQEFGVVRTEDVGQTGCRG
jgi:hypothetical protein